MRFVKILMLSCALTTGAMAAPPNVAVPPNEDMLTQPSPTQGFGPLAQKLSAQLSQAKDKASDQASGLITNAMDLLGMPYKRGGNSEATGFDCSGFVRHLYEKSVGQLLPRRAEEQARATEVIARDELKPGDLVFFNTMRRAFSHVGIYVGDGKFIHSPRAGKAVNVEDMRSAYWQKRFNGARRVPMSGDNPFHENPN